MVVDLVMTVGWSHRLVMYYVVRGKIFARSMSPRSQGWDAPATRPAYRGCTCMYGVNYRVVLRLVN